MTEKNWTEGPWVVEPEDDKIMGDGGTFAITGVVWNRPDAARIVSCVNGCKDIPNPEGLGELVTHSLRALRKMKIEYRNAIKEHHQEEVQDETECWSECEGLEQALHACGIGSEETSR